MEDLSQFDHLAASADGQAAALGAPAGPAPGAVPGTAVAVVPGTPPGPDFAAEARMCVDLFASMVTGYAPRAEDVWKEEARARTAAALAPVLMKYQVSFGNLPVELVLLVTAGPLLWQSSRLVAQQMAEDKAKANAKRTVDAQAREVAPGQVADAPAPAVHPQTALYPG